MMTMTSSLVLSFFLVSSLKSMNPIKVSINILAASSCLFLMMGVCTGVVWFSIILLLLFMGGIIMMFMILSSILPNEKSLKPKVMTFLMFCLIFTSLWSPLSCSSESVAMNMNSFLISSLSFVLMMSLILFYFLASMSILSSEKTPMRTLTCF